MEVIISFIGLPLIANKVENVIQMVSHVKCCWKVKWYKGSEISLWRVEDHL